MDLSSLAVSSLSRFQSARRDLLAQLKSDIVALKATILDQYSAESSGQDMIEFMRARLDRAVSSGDESMVPTFQKEDSAYEAAAELRGSMKLVRLLGVEVTGNE